MCDHPIKERDVTNPLCILYRQAQYHYTIHLFKRRFETKNSYYDSDT